MLYKGKPLTEESLKELKAIATVALDEELFNDKELPLIDEKLKTLHNFVEVLEANNELLYNESNILEEILKIDHINKTLKGYKEVSHENKANETSEADSSSSPSISAENIEKQLKQAYKKEATSDVEGKETASIESTDNNAKSVDDAKAVDTSAENSGSLTKAEDSAATTESITGSEEKTVSSEKSLNMNIVKSEDKAQVNLDKYISELRSEVLDIVQIPEFKDTFSTLKYIYEYYIGNTKVALDSGIDEAKDRMNEFSQVQNFNTMNTIIKKYNEDNPYERPGDLANEHTSEQLKHKINLIPSASDLPQNYKPDELQQMFEKKLKGILESERKNQPVDWEYHSHNQMSIKIYHAINKFKIYRNYKDLSDNGKLHVYQEQEKLTKAHTMRLTEDFRNEAQKTLEINNNILSRVNNLNEKNSVGFKTEDNTTGNSKHSDIIEDMFADYFTKRKQKHNYISDKISKNREDIYSFKNVFAGEYDKKLEKNNKEDMHFDHETFVNLSNVNKGKFLM